MVEDDDELIRWALADRRDDKLRRLLEGDIAGYSSQSEAELALLGILVRWTQDPVRLDRLYRRSGLRRHKWDERRGSSTYGERTIRRALENHPVTAGGFGSTEPNRIGVIGTDLGGPTNAHNGASGESGLRFWTPDDVLHATSDEIEWLLEGFITGSAKLLLAGYPKIGKSTLLLFLLSALHRGESVLGLDISRASWLLLTEEGHHSLKEKLFTFGLRGSDCSIVFHRDAFGIPWPQLIEQAVEACQERGHRLLLVDTLGTWGGLVGEEENRAGAVAKALAPLNAAVAADISVVVIHHTRKGGGEHGEAIRGSSAFTGLADVVTEIRHSSTDDRVRVLRSWSRFQDTPDELGIRLAESGDSYELVDVAEERKERGAGETEGRLLEALERSQPPPSS